MSGIWILMFLHFSAGIPPTVHGDNGIKVLENMNNPKSEGKNVVPGSLSSATKTADASAKVEYSKDSFNSTIRQGK